MLATAEVVAERYGIDRERQDAFALRSQQRTAAAQQQGRFDAEIVPISTQRRVVDRDTGEAHLEPVTLSADECNRPDTTADDLASLAPVIEGGRSRRATPASCPTARPPAWSWTRRGGRAARDRTARHLPAASPWRAVSLTRWASARCSRSRACSSAPASTVDDIDLWELNEAFASQAVYCADTLGLPEDRLNVNGGAISVGHPYGMSGTRLVGHALLEGPPPRRALGRRHDVRRRRHGRRRAVRDRLSPGTS